MFVLISLYEQRTTGISRYCERLRERRAEVKHESGTPPNELEEMSSHGQAKFFRDFLSPGIAERYS